MRPRRRQLRLVLSVSRHSALVTRHWFSAIFLFLFSIFCLPSAFALDPSLDISQYAHTSWKVRDGFANGAIEAIAQSSDGYLWVGTEFGLVRFDGVRAVPWEPPPGQQLPDVHITTLLLSRDGTLWIGTRKGLASWKYGKLTVYPEVAGKLINSLLQDPEGTVWFGSWSPGALCAEQASKVHCYAGGTLGRWVGALFRDSKGRLWVAAETGLWRWLPGVPTRYTFPYGTVEINSVIENDDGTLLLATNDGLKQLVEGKIRSYALPGINGKVRPIRFFRSSDGSLWVGTQQGLLHVHQGTTDTFGAADGLSGDVIAAFLEDHEGDVWVSTLNGLDRFRGYAVPGISNREGLVGGTVLSVQATRDGSVWISTPNALNRWQNGRVTVYSRQVGTTQAALRGERESTTSRAVRNTESRGLDSTPRSLGLDEHERLWVSTGGGIFYFAGDRFIRVPNSPNGNIWSIAGDRHGKMWVNDGSAGLFHFTPGEAVKPIPWSRFGQDFLGPEALLPDGSNGGVWLGFDETGLAYFKDNEVHASYNAADGLGKGRVNDLRLDSHSTLWAATEGGLSRIKDGHVSTLTIKNGLPCDTANWTVEDYDHFIWLYMACGLVRVSRPELDAWASDSSRKIKIMLYDSSDGVQGESHYGGYGPHVTQSQDGRIWFAGKEGVSVIDPRHLPHNGVPPPVHIEQITADGKNYDPSAVGSARLKLPGLVRNLDIDYTALSLVVPEKVRFRVKLEGQDKDWRELVNVRHLEYTNLAPKRYRFLVKAANNSGVWNEEGAALDFVIPPAWYQTYWFGALCVAVFLTLLFALYQMRLRQVAHQFNMRLEERVGERTRIARDLHDTLLQSFQGLVFRFQAVRNHLPERPEEAGEVLDSALVSADQALAEGRSSIRELRAEPLKESDMEHMLLRLGQELASSQNGRDPAPTLRVIVEGTRRAKRAMIREEIYRIARELLRNAYRHANARSIEAELRYDADAFALLVRDDGKGIDPQVLKEHGRAGHWGLSGMYERAEGMGARLDVWSEAGAGTEVRLTVPGSIAYEKSGHGGRFKLFRKTRIHEHRS